MRHLRQSAVSSGLIVLALVSQSVAAERTATVNRLTEAQRRGQWRLLFDGRSTAGWRGYRKSSISDGWKVRDGALTRVARNAGSIVSEEQFTYFELSMEYRIAKGGNSGLMFHVTEEANAPWKTGPEVQILDNKEGKDPQKAGWLYQLYKPVKPDWAKRFERQVGFSTPEVSDATRPAGEWNHIYLRVAPNQCEVAVNGVSYYYFQLGTDDWNQRVAASKFAKYAGFGKAGKGHICLQDHGDPVAFRSIKIRELPEDGSVPQPIDGKLPVQVVEAFPGLEWDGWSPVDDDGKIVPMRPMVLTHVNDNSGRIFVGTQSGTISVLPKGRKSTKTQVFLDIRDRVQDWQKDDEEGMLGFAFHPKNGKLYVYYSSEAEPRTSIVSRFSVSEDDPNRALPESEELVMKIPQPFANHNGGSIAFGPDGYLYIALGDGGGRNDPMGHGQNLATWMGSILRIDVDRRTNATAYAIPSDNPFINRRGAKPEIYAYGLRNVWRMSFDRHTGDLWIGDVGQDLWEEIHLVKAGGNYGWSSREGSHAFGPTAANSADEPQPPVWEYDHQVGKSITGGFVYRGKAVAALAGRYVYSDYVSGRIWALEYDRDSGKVVSNMEIPSKNIPAISFGEDADGELYFMTQNVNGRGIYSFAPSEE